ncbi:VWA domain-containing protein [Pseudooceanicola sp.]|uniref:vWA domain-containing protein n=1 Tax=Pseudooceanicola sp. TaxID=1914328 RepID=UPI002635EEA5|nr:VWA domain-containing protein [Pseudooceanicola sp.]MDF1855522.1 VWA domain-containing protein [Pseudooceanicola sp.]
MLAWLILALPGLAENRSMIVLDGSGSMWGQIEGKSKIEIAHAVLGDVLGAVPAESELGLIVYGHRSKGDCADIEVAVPAAKGTGAAIGDFAKGISPKGKTPLTDAVRLAAETLKYTESKSTVILVTDGLETCDADPCALGRELERLGVNFTAHVVGFGLTDAEGAQVACLAEETGGSYFQASDAGQLSAALTETVVAVADPAPAPAPEPAAAPEPEDLAVTLHISAALSEDGPDLSEVDERARWQIYAAGADGQPSGDRIKNSYGAGLDAKLPAGDYAVKVSFAQVIDLVLPVHVAANELTESHVVLNVGHITVTPKTAPDATEPNKAVRVQVFSGGKRANGYGQSAFYMPAGELRILATHAGAEATETLMLKAGAREARELIVGAGVVYPKALYAEGGPAVENNDVRFIVQSAEVDLKGRRKNIHSVYGSRAFDMPVGDYVLFAKLGTAEVTSPPFKVEAGKRVELQVVMNAGVLALATPGAYRVQLFEAKKDINGKQKRVQSAYGEAHQWTLAAGKYLAHATYKDSDVVKETTIEVIAGERAEVTLD